MTEIPEHLRKRARDARLKHVGKRNEPSAKPVASFFEAPPAPPKRPDGWDWTRYGSRPTDIAQEVLTVIRTPHADTVVTTRAQKSRKTTGYTEHYDLSEVATKTIGPDLYLRIGHVISLEVEKPTTKRAQDAVLNFGKEMVMGRGYARTFDHVAGEISTEEFDNAMRFGNVTRAHTIPWAELTVDQNGPDQHGLTMLTSFCLRIAHNTVDDPADLFGQRWGSSAQVVYPLTNGRHEGRHTRPPYDYTEPGEKLFRPRTVWQFRMPGGVDWIGSDADTQPSAIDVIETTMNGLAICVEMMRDPDIGAQADAYNQRLQAALLPVSTE